MAVYRVNKNRGYTVMANFHLRDKSLSLKAVGLLSKMLSFNDGWKLSTKGLSAICKEGPDAILSALRELEKHGYLVRHRQRDGKGRMSSTIFEIYEEPQESTPEREIPHTENPCVEKPDVDNPRGDKSAQINTDQVITQERNTLSKNYQSINLDGMDRMDERSEYGLNYQKTGKELMSQDEIAVMDGAKCILQLRGVRPFLSNKYDITKHPKYRQLSDYNKRNAFDIEKYRQHKLVVKPDDTFDLYDMGEVEAD